MGYPYPPSHGVWIHWSVAESPWNHQFSAPAVSPRGPGPRGCDAKSRIWKGATLRAFRGVGEGQSDFSAEGDAPQV